jgi:hypothetical protein
MHAPQRRAPSKPRGARGAEKAPPLPPMAGLGDGCATSEYWGRCCWSLIIVVGVSGDGMRGWWTQGGVRRTVAGSYGTGVVAVVVVVAP